MTIAVLFPRREYAGIAQRHASWQTQSRLRRADDVSEIIYYDDDEPAKDVVDGIDEPHVLVVLDPLVIVEHDIATRLRQQLDGVVSVPQLLYFCATETLRDERRSLQRAIDGREITIATIGKWQRQPPPDLLPFIPLDARSLLHVGCGDGALGAQVKERQRCRVAGIESNRDLASAAKRRLDDVYSGDIADIVSILDEQFDCIVTGGVLENTLDPWSLLGDLRRVGRRLVASIPNVANLRVIDDLREGHFPVADQVRFFTPESIVELVDIAGWNLERIEPLSETQFIVIAG